jgi:hypothetical protein
MCHPQIAQILKFICAICVMCERLSYGVRLQFVDLGSEDEVALS